MSAKHVHAGLMRNVRSVCAKLDPSIKVTGNTKAWQLRQQRDARKAAPCVTMSVRIDTGETLDAAMLRRSMVFGY